MNIKPTLLPATVALAAMCVWMPGCNHETKPDATPPSADRPAATSDTITEQSQLDDDLLRAILAGEWQRAIDLLDEGASPNVVDAHGISALHYACRATHPELVQALIEHGADVNVGGPNDVKPIHWTIRAGSAGRPGGRETIDLLLAHGADINARIAGGAGTMDMLARLGNDEWTAFLVSRGLKPDGEPAQEERSELNAALLDAILADDEARAIELVNEGASVHTKNENGVTVIFLAAAGCISCEGALPELTRVLLENGADVNADVQGTRPIHWVARAGAGGREGTKETLDLLLQYGADINERGAANMRPIDFAVRAGNEEWVAVLESRGATRN